MSPTVSSMLVYSQSDVYILVIIFPHCINFMIVALTCAVMFLWKGCGTHYILYSNNGDNIVKTQHLVVAVAMIRKHC